MIYLIDDKKSRQVQLDWNQIKFEKFNSILKAVYSFNQIEKEKLNTKGKIYSADSIILFHESFFDHIDNLHKKESDIIRNELYDWADKNNVPLILFSGSNNTRSINGKRVSLPVKLLYQNLELFVNSILNNDDIEKSLKILLYGEKFNLEEILQLKKEIWETKFKLSPVLNNKINEFNALTSYSIDLKVTQDPTLLKSLINE
jgi:hypothetical protein